MSIREEWENACNEVLTEALQQDRHHYIGMVQDVMMLLRPLYEPATVHQEVLDGIQALNLEYDDGVIAVACIPQEALALPEALALQKRYPAQKAA